MKPIFYTLVITLLLLGCGKDSNLLCGEADPDQINVRIFNTSSYEIENLNYDNIQTFNSILSGETTSYIQLANSWDVPSLIEMTIEGEMISKHLIDQLGLSKLEPGCHTYLLHAYEYDDGDIYSGGRIYKNDILLNFDPVNQDCVELEKSECNPQSDKANIRLKNATAFDFCNVEVDMNDQDHVLYGNIASGESSCYISLEMAKEYPLLCRFLLGEEEYIIENPTYHERLDELSPGFYTYNISVIRPNIKLATIQMSNN